MHVVHFVAPPYFSDLLWALLLLIQVVAHVDEKNTLIITFKGLRIIILDTSLGIGLLIASPSPLQALQRTCF